MVGMSLLGTLPRRVERDATLPVMDHLDELRRRVAVCGLTLVLAFVAMYVVHDSVIQLLVSPLPGDRRLITLSPTEPFVTVLKVTLWSSVLVALPVWLYQAYAFVIPAVADQSRRVMLAIVAGVAGLFGVGVVFGYAVVLPAALRFLIGFGGDAFDEQVRATEYFGFATSLLLASGLLFEVPVAMAALARMGLASAHLYRTQWRVALVAIAAIAAALPGGDPISMLLLMAPQIVLYGVGIALAARLEWPDAPLHRGWRSL